MEAQQPQPPEVPEQPEVASIEYSEYSAVRALANRILHPIQSVTHALDQLAAGLGSSHHRY